MSILLKVQSELSVVTRAVLFATEAHAEVGQVRKYTGDPYIVHPLRVMYTVQSVTQDLEVIAASVMHDVIEDTLRKKADIVRHFGTRIANLVDEVTDVSKPEDGNREQRKKLDREHVACASADGQTIKLADLIDNGEDIMANDPKFGRVYIREKILLLEVLGRGDRRLFERAVAQVKRNEATLLVAESLERKIA